ncbi:MAG: hypothetical protein ABEL97_05210 [Salinibacter sp.]
MCFSLLAVWIALLGPGGPSPAWAQDSTRAPADTTQPWYNTAWTPIVEKEGVRFGYIFYSKADNYNNGVVIRLHNQNDRPVRYAFTVIFRGPSGEATSRAEGRLAPGEMKTGETDGLFWIPFTDGRAVGEVGLRGIEITPITGDSSATRRG